MKLSINSIKFYIPYWDDIVYDKYDYYEDKPKDDGVKVHAHEFFSTPTYDGILVSKHIFSKNINRLNKISKIGIHKYLNFKGDIFGDCGAYSYSNLKKPPITTDEILEFYNKMDVNRGVSIDHLCLKQYKSDWVYRKNITMKNAVEFFEKWREGNYNFIPVGAAQGWDKESYRDSIKNLLEIGYRHIAIGGLVRSTREDIISLLEYSQDLIKKYKPDIHLFGVGRLNIIGDLIKLGVSSIDSASALRQAWTGTKSNYRGEKFEGYTALRIPSASKMNNKKFIAMEKQGLFTRDELQDWEYIFKSYIGQFERGESVNEELLEAFEEFDNIFMLYSGNDLSKDYRRTLEDEPWKRCKCDACRALGIQIVIFQGNNRNRMRGFHNTYVFYNLLQKINKNNDYMIELNGKSIISNVKLDQYFETIS